MKKKFLTTGILVLLAVFSFAACSAPGATTVAVEEPETPLYLPEARAEIVHAGQDPATGESWSVDVSAASRGYILAGCTTQLGLGELLIKKDGAVTAAGLPGTGESQCLPLSRGDGHYEISLNLPVDEDHVRNVETFSLDVALEDDKLPFLVPVQMIHYNEVSQIVAFARGFAEADTEQALVSDAFNWVCDNVAYDATLVDDNTKTYLSDLDRVLREKTGICIDYASFFAACLRINGIPCQVVEGYLETPEGPVFHAWNRVWRQGGDGGEWTAMDPTFSAAYTRFVRAVGLDRTPDGYAYGPIEQIY